MKIINPKNGGGNVIESWFGEVFSTVEQMSDVLGEEFADLIQGNKYEFGYMDRSRHERKTETHRDTS